MAVFRIERKNGYTVMSNCHLRDKNLSLKSKGLLSQMLSLPEDWDYTLSGLATINKEKIDAIRSAIKELEEFGYVKRKRTVDSSGRFSKNEYVIYEQPQNFEQSPSLDFSTSDNPTLEKPTLENPTQLNTNIQNKDLSIKDKQNDRLIDREASFANFENLVKEKIDYASLIKNNKTKIEEIDEITQLIVEVLLSTKETIRVAGGDVSSQFVKERFRKLNGMHIDYVLYCLDKNAGEIKNIKNYLLTVLYNAPITISNFYSNMVKRDMA